MGFGFGNALAAVTDPHIRACLERLARDSRVTAGSLSVLVRNNASTSELIAGAGLTGGGALNSSTSVTFDVGAGTGILVAANSVAVDTSYFAGLYQPLDADLTSWAAITRAAGFDTFTATPTSANLASLVTDENGSGTLIFADGTLAITAAKTLTATATLTLSGTDSTTMTFPTTSATIARMDAAQSFTGLQTFTAGISLGASGTITSDEVDGGGQPALDFLMSQARATDPILRLRNTSSSINFLTATSAGEYAFGPVAVSISGDVLAFNVNDAASPSSLPAPAAGSWRRGISSNIIHGSASVVPPLAGVVGLYGSAALATGSNTTAHSVAGVAGIAQSASDANTYGTKEIAGVIGNIATIGDTTDPFALPVLGSKGAAGNWKRAAALYGTYFNSFAANTNNPAIASGVYAAIPRQSPTECWGLETDNPTGGNVRAVGIVGAAKFVFPAFGTRTTHTYWVPKAAAALGPVGNASGDVYFDSGANNTIGIHEYDGTAWRKLLVADKAFTITGGWTFNSDITISDTKNIILNATTGTKIGTAASQKIGFWNATPVAQPAAYTPSNVSADRSYDANSTTIDELADILGTLIADLQTMGLVA